MYFLTRLEEIQWAVLCFSPISLMFPVRSVCPGAIRIQQPGCPRGGAPGGGLSWCEDCLRVPVGTGDPGEPLEPRGF